MPTLRPATITDEPFLWIALTWAAHMPGDGTPDDVASALQNPGLARYVKGWGRQGDIGVIGVDGDGNPVGGAWVRSMRAYGFVHEDVPELSIGTAPDWRGRGLGTALLRDLLARTDALGVAVSLSVRNDNPAARLYERLGFSPIDGSMVENRVGGESFTMLRPKLSTSGTSLPGK